MPKHKVKMKKMCLMRINFKLQKVPVKGKKLRKKTFIKNLKFLWIEPIEIEIKSCA